jgi:hypothetical protein
MKNLIYLLPIFREKYRGRLIRLADMLINNSISKCFVLCNRFDELPVEKIRTFVEKCINYNLNNRFIIFHDDPRDDVCELLETCRHSQIIVHRIKYPRELYYKYDYSDHRPKMKAFLSENCRLI